MSLLQTIKESLLHVFYPHVCAGCGTDMLPVESQLCIKCLHQLPVTGFEKHAGNPIEKIFSGRVRFRHATAQYYFTKESVLQALMHQFKYKGNKDIGHQLGILMGHQLKESGRFNEVEALIPLPLFEAKERKRGYNQSQVLCKGMAEVLKINIMEDVVERPIATETQTHKSRVERWKNMEGKFRVKKEKEIIGKHILLVDDVITTGATIESCAATLLEVSGLQLSIATLCYASKI